jgi:uncharacterized protein
MTVATELDFKNYYVEGLYMSANVETGVLVNRSGRRMIALTNDFLLGLHRALQKECGDRVDRVLYHCGKKWGRSFGKGLDDAWAEFYQCPTQDFPLSLFQSLLVQEFGHNGWGVLRLGYSHYNQGVIELSLLGAIMSDITDCELSYPADQLTAGILAGLFTHFVNRELDSVQSQCAMDGHSDSRFLLSDPARIHELGQWNESNASHSELLAKLLTLTSPTSEV